MNYTINRQFEQDNTEIIFKGVLTSWIIFLILLTVVLVFVYDIYNIRVMVAATTVVVNCIIYIIHWWNYRFLARVLLITNTWVTCTVVAFGTAGLHSPIMMGYILAVLLAGLILNLRQAAFFTGLIVVTQISLFAVENSGLQQYDLTETNLFSTLLFQVLVILVTFFTIVLNVRRIHNYTSLNQEGTKALDEANQQLLGMQQDLESQVTSRTERLNAVITLTERLSAILDVSELLSEFAKSLREFFEYDHVDIYIIDNQHANLLLQVTESVAPIRSTQNRPRYLTLDRPTNMVVNTARKGEMTWSNNMASVGYLANENLIPLMRSELSLPILIDGQLYGVVDIQDQQLNRFNQYEADTLQSIASQVAVAIRNARFFEQVEQTLTETKALQERYVSEAWQHRPDGTREHLYTRPGENPLPSEVLGTGQRLALNDFSPTMTEISDIPSLVSPVFLGDQTIGSLQLHRHSQNGPNDPWSSDDVAIVSAVVEQISQIAENQRLFDEIRDQASREQVIREITEKMRAATTLEDLVKTVAEELGQKLPLKYALVELGTTDEV